MNNTKETGLLFCILMDAIGYFSYTIPFLGEFSDIVWAPLSAIIFYKTFGGWKGALGGLFDFAEEIIPGTDFIPSFTLMWLWQKFMRAGERKERLKMKTIKL